MPDSPITLNFQTVGTLNISADRPPKVSRVGAGLLVRFPITGLVRNYTPTANGDSQTTVPVRVSEITGKLHFRTESSYFVEMGRLVSDGGFASESQSCINLEWYATFADVALMEKRRAGGRVHLKFELKVMCHLVLEAAPKKHRVKADEEGGTVQIEVEYPTRAWIEAIRSAGVCESIVVEVPVSASPPEPWDEVWNALRDARASFDQGGSTGWINAVRSVRRGFEKWSEIAKEDLRHPKIPVPDDDIKKMVKEDRIKALRFWARHLSQLGPHGDAEDWSREDAVMMLTLFAAMLSERNP